MVVKEASLIEGLCEITFDLRQDPNLGLRFSPPPLPFPSAASPPPLHVAVRAPLLRELRRPDRRDPAVRALPHDHTPLLTWSPSSSEAED